MQPSHKTLIDNLIPFLERLRGQGYSISTQQIMSAHWLLTSMAERGAMPDDPAQLADWLGPILCTTPRQQSDFPKQFERWIKSLEQGPTPIRVEPTSLIDAYVRKIEPIRKRGLRLITLALVVFVAAAGWWIWQRPRKPETVSQQRIVTDPPPPPQSEAKKVIETINSTIPATLCILGGTVFIVSSGFWLIAKRVRVAVNRINRLQAERQIDRLVARKGESDERVGLELRIQSASPWSPAGKGAYRQAVPALLERSEVAPNAQTLNVRSTIDRWIRDEGRFEPVYARRKVTPEYLALIDRISAHDHQAEWAEAMLDTLSDAQVSITRYEFARDPRSCRPLRGPSRDRSFSLRDLAERFHDHRLLIFTNGEGLIDPRRAQPAAWLERFSAWPDRVIFTFRPRSTWGAFEQGLVEAGFQVCPSTPQGIAEVSRALAGWNQRVSGSSNESVPIPIRPIPRRLREEPERWIDAHPPETWEIEAMLADLRLYLDDNYPWLAACAVYPELRWDLTRELGRVVFAEEDQTDTLESGLAQLTRLPWFREGSMPDWLRLHLLRELDSTLKERVKNALHQLIMGAQRVEVAGFGSENRLSALVASTSQPLARKAEEVRKAAVQLDATSTWADPVLNHFLEPEPSNSLAFELPKNVIQSLGDLGPDSQALPKAPKSEGWIPDWLLAPLALLVGLFLVCMVVLLGFFPFVLPYATIPLALWGLHVRSGWKLGRRQRLFRGELFLSVVFQWVSYVLLWCSIWLSIYGAADYYNSDLGAWVNGVLVLIAVIASLLGIFRTIRALINSATDYAARIHKSMLIFGVSGIAIGLVCYVAVRFMPLRTGGAYGLDGLSGAFPIPGTMLALLVSLMSLTYELSRHLAMRGGLNGQKLARSWAGDGGEFSRNLMRALTVVMSGSFAAVLVGMLWIVLTPDPIAPSQGDQVDGGSESGTRKTSDDKGGKATDQVNLPPPITDQGEQGLSNTKGPTGSEKESRKEDPPPYGGKGKADTPSDFKQEPQKRAEKPKS